MLLIIEKMKRVQAQRRGDIVMTGTRYKMRTILTLGSDSNDHLMWEKIISWKSVKNTSKVNPLTPEILTKQGIKSVQ